jgi:hypothetical protein
MADRKTDASRGRSTPQPVPSALARRSYEGIRILELSFRPPHAIARLGGGETPLESFIWSDDPTIAGAASTVIEPAITLEVTPEGSVRPYLPGTIRFREGGLFRPVAPFFEMWVRYQSPDDATDHDEPLTLDILRDLGASPANLSYVVTASNRKAARRTRDEACSFQAQVQVAGDDCRRIPLLASSPNRPGTEPLVPAEHPIPLGAFQVIRPILGDEMGVDLSILRVRFTPARGEVYGPPRATEAPAPGTARTHLIVKPDNRFLNPNAAWTRYDADYAKFDNPEPSDTYDGADVDAGLAWGVVDDTCDAIIEASLVIAGRRWQARARVFSGPPDFAPDRRPFLSLADDLADRELPPPGAIAPAEQSDVEKEINDLFQRVFETASLSNLDATRARALGENQRAGATNPAEGLPKVDAASMTGDDRPYADLAVDLNTRPTSVDPLPYADLERQAHAKLADLDLMVEYLRLAGAHVRELLRPPYGAFAELREQPGPDPDPGHRDPRVARDRAHDMRMPPYMRDSDATALSLTRRQYHQVLALIDRLQVQYQQAASDAGLPTDAAAMRAVLTMRAGRAVAEEGRPAPVIESPIRRRVRAYLAGLDGHASEPSRGDGDPQP